ARAGKPAPPHSAFLGELALDGSVRHVDGVLVAARGLSSLGYERVFVPVADAAEAALVDGLEVIPCPSLIAVVNHVLGLEPIAPSPPKSLDCAAPADIEHALAEIHGQEEAKRALEVAAAGLIGGGSGLAQPGEISRANHGVLFLDELAEFQTPVLQALRQPLESGRVNITRSGGSVMYPASFTLIAATNPCPCGWAGD